MMRSSIIWIVAEIIAGAVFTVLTPYVPLPVLIVGILVLQVILYLAITWGLWKKESKENLSKLMKSVKQSPPH